MSDNDNDQANIQDNNTNNPLLLNIDDVPWQLCLTKNITEDAAMELIATLNWYPESKNYFGILCRSNQHNSVGMYYEYFYTAEEAINYAINGTYDSTLKSYFLLRQMTEEELKTTLERIKMSRLSVDERNEAERHMTTAEIMRGIDDAGWDEGPTEF